MVSVILGTLNDKNIYLQKHAILITGTRKYNNKYQLRIFDPNKEKENKWVDYIGENTVFISTWAWKSSYIPIDHAPNNY